MFLINLKIDDRFNTGLGLPKGVFQPFSLNFRPWKSIQNKSVLTVWLFEPFQNQGNYQFVRHQLAGIHKLPGLFSQLGFLPHRRAQQIPG